MPYSLIYMFHFAFHNCWMYAVVHILQDYYAAATMISMLQRMVQSWRETCEQRSYMWLRGTGEHTYVKSCKLWTRLSEGMNMQHIWKPLVQKAYQGTRASKTLYTHCTSQWHGALPNSLKIRCLSRLSRLACRRKFTLQHLSRYGLRCSRQQLVHGVGE